MFFGKSIPKEEEKVSKKRKSPRVANKILNLANLYAKRGKNGLCRSDPL